jgi:hypothetical protein
MLQLAATLLPAADAAAIRRCRQLTELAKVLQQGEDEGEREGAKERERERGREAARARAQDAREAMGAARPAASRQGDDADLDLRAVD